MRITHHYITFVLDKLNTVLNSFVYSVDNVEEEGTELKSPARLKQPLLRREVEGEEGVR